MAEAGPHLRACIEAALESGLRKGEITGSTQAGARLAVKDAMSQAKGKRSSSVIHIGWRSRRRACLMRVVVIPGRDA